MNICVQILRYFLLLCTFLWRSWNMSYMRPQNGPMSLYVLSYMRPQNGPMTLYYCLIWGLRTVQWPCTYCLIWGPRTVQWPCTYCFIWGSRTVQWPCTYCLYWMVLQTIFSKHVTSDLYKRYLKSNDKSDLSSFQWLAIRRYGGILTPHLSSRATS
jgi:hypothetical protein